MNIKLGNMELELTRTEVIGYRYRQVQLKNIIGMFDNDFRSETHVSDDMEMHALHEWLAKEANVKPDNHQAFNVGGLWFKFDDWRVYIATDATVGFIGQY